MKYIVLASYALFFFMQILHAMENKREIQKIKIGYLTTTLTGHIALAIATKDAPFNKVHICQGNHFFDFTTCREDDKWHVYEAVCNQEATFEVEESIPHLMLHSVIESAAMHKN